MGNGTARQRADITKNNETLSAAVKAQTRRGKRASRDVRTCFRPSLNFYRPLKVTNDFDNIPGLGSALWRDCTNN